MTRLALPSRLRRWLRPPRTLRPTRAGWIYFAVTFGVGFASLNTGNNLQYLVFAFLLAFLVLSGVLSEAALRGLDVRRRLPREMYATTPATVVLEVHNAQKRIPSYAIVVEELLGPGLESVTSGGRIFVLRVAPGGSEARSYRLTAGERGWLDFAGFRVSTRFPFGLFSKAMLLERPERALVYPAIAPVATLSADPACRDPGAVRGRVDGTGAEVVGLREFAPGDAARHIHWPASLRRDGLMVRDRERDEGAELTVHLARRRRTAGPDFESSVQRAASEVVAHLDAGYRVGLASEESRFEPATGARQQALLLGFLAQVEPELRGDATLAKHGARE